jgi:hypothetical protein
LIAFEEEEEEVEEEGGNFQVAIASDAAVDFLGRPRLRLMIRFEAATADEGACRPIFFRFAITFDAPGRTAVAGLNIPPPSIVQSGCRSRKYRANSSSVSYNTMSRPTTGFVRIPCALSRWTTTRR